jgi:response regulator of citrate/malate metabolism
MPMEGRVSMIKVLIVECDPMVRRINESFLSKVKGFTLQKSVDSIKKSKKLILTDKPDLILLDVFFPNDSGIEFLKWIRINEIKCDVIIITRNKSMETVEEALRYGAVDYLIKPFVFKRFKEALVRYEKMKNIFQTIKNAEQEIIDKITLKGSSLNYKDDNYDNVQNIKGVSQNTYEKIIECINKNNSKAYTAQEIGELAGISRITARRYLDVLEKEGKVILEVAYGKIGRPLNKYKLIDKQQIQEKNL